MCFRPATVGSSVDCPDCGTKNPEIAMKCIKCKKDLSELTKDARAALLGGGPAPSIAAPSAVALNSAPKGPVPPASAPKVPPKAPGA